MIAFVWFSLKRAWQGFWRNAVMSLAATATMVLMLLLLAGFWIIQAGLLAGLEFTEQKVEVVAYIQPNATETQIEALADDIWPGPTSPGRGHHPGPGARAFRESDGGAGPRGPHPVPRLEPAVRQHRGQARPTRPVGEVSEALSPEEQPIVRNVINIEDLVERVLTVTNILRTAGTVILIVVGIICLFIIVNTIRLAVFARAEEIEIMRLVGASDAFIRWPFVFEGAFVGLLGSLITLGVLAAAADPLSGFMMEFFRILPLQVGSLSRDLDDPGDGRRGRARDRRLVGVRPDLPHPLTASAAGSPASMYAAPRDRSHDRPVRPRPRRRRTSRPRPSATAPVAVARSSRAGRRIPIVPLAIALVAVLAGSALFMSGYSVGRQTAAEPGTPVSEDEAFRPFWDTYHTITERYAGGEVDRAAIIQGAIRGMIEALDDPYSSYLTSDEYRDSLQGISGEFEGIGAEIATEDAAGEQGCATLGPDCRLVIVAPLAGSPAERAGLRSGDLVLAADGISLDGLTVDGARDRIRGPKGSVVTLTVQRDEAEPFALEITRDVILQEEVERATWPTARSATSDSTASRIAAPTSWRRRCERTWRPGGRDHPRPARQSRRVRDGGAGRGQPVHRLRRRVLRAGGGRRRTTPTDALPGGAVTDPSLPVIALIDGGSASASEIVAGALQDTGRATLVGQTTFGKGTVQQWQELPGEGGAFRLTVARWLTPDGRWIHESGIAPDVAVEPPDDLGPDEDPVLDRALEILGGTGRAGRLIAA